MDLSLLIPARNEEFIRKTIENILENIEGDTEIIAVLDGYWPEPCIPQHPRVTIIHHQESIGQRAATNEAARVSTAKYIMKVDAHCAFDKGFDVKMMRELEGHEDWTMVPRMYNLHAFDWVCDCGHRIYQGPTPEKCEKCGGEMKKEIVWKPRLSRKSDFMRFDNTLHFQYWGRYEERPEAKNDIADQMCCIGACWMMRRARYWEIDGMDEAHGSWGQMGVELACKTWLSGGRQVVNKKTWFAHMFRTQGGDFGFPYPNHGIEAARQYSRELWQEGKWPKAKYPLSWLIDKFAPVPDWDVSKGIIYYTDNELDSDLMVKCQKQLKSAIGQKKLISVSLKKIDFGDNIALDLERGYLTMFKQILAGLEAIDTDIVFFGEHDVLYHPSHFDFIPPKKDVFYYNTNVWKLRLSDGHAIHYDCKQTSGLCAYRELLLDHYRKRVKMVKDRGFSRKMGFEPGTHNRPERVDDHKAEAWQSEYPNVDIRHDKNLTPSRWNQDQFRNKKNCAGWTEADEIPGWDKIL